MFSLFVRPVKTKRSGQLIDLSAHSISLTGWRFKRRGGVSKGVIYLCLNLFLMFLIRTFISSHILYFGFWLLRKGIKTKERLVHLVLHPHEIAPNFLKLDLWSLWADFIPIISTKGINQIKKEKLQIKLCFMHIKRFHNFFKIWVQFHVYLSDSGVVSVLIGVGRGRKKGIEINNRVFSTILISSKT